MFFSNLGHSQEFKDLYDLVMDRALVLKGLCKVGSKVTDTREMELEQELRKSANGDQGQWLDKFEKGREYQKV